MNKTMSPEQIEANRCNALKSTGPLTPEGKTASCSNALKHGILSRQVVVRGHHIKESRDEFESFYRQYYEHLAPIGPLEEMLVDEIIATNWRLRRARTAESAEVALSVDGGVWGHRKANECRSLRQILEDSVLRHTSSVGVAWIENSLRELRDTIARGGKLDADALETFECAFADSSDRIFQKLDDLRFEEADKERILDYLDQELKNLRERFLQLTERESIEEQARQEAAVLPPAQTLDKILRYETALDRRLFRAVSELERLQRRRLGENVPGLEQPFFHHVVGPIWNYLLKRPICGGRPTRHGGDFAGRGQLDGAVFGNTQQPDRSHLRLGGIFGRGRGRDRRDVSRWVQLDTAKFWRLFCPAKRFVWQWLLPGGGRQ
jgi:hypothetical protein